MSVCSGSRTSDVDYHIRQAKDSGNKLLLLHSKVEFVLAKDKMKFTLNGKKYEYRGRIRGDPKSEGACRIALRR